MGNAKLCGSKIIVLGCSGSGKSTFARKLHQRTGIPLFHLDMIWWKPDRTHIARDAFDRELEKLMRGAEWIIDGDYSRTYETRLRACDTAVFLDLSETECMEGIIARLGTERPDMPWTEHELDPELVELVRKYRGENRPLICALMEKYPEKQWLVFKSRGHADAWLSALPPLPIETL